MFQAGQIRRLECGADGFPALGQGSQGADASQRMIGRADAGEFPSLAREDGISVGGAEFPPVGPKSRDLGARRAGGWFGFFEEAGQTEKQGFAARGGCCAGGHALGEELEREFVVFVAERNGNGFVEGGVGSARRDHGLQGGAFGLEAAAGGDGQQVGDLCGRQCAQRGEATSGPRGGKSGPFGVRGRVVGQADLRHFTVRCGAGEMLFDRAVDDDMQDDIFIGGIDRMTVLFPSRSFEIDLDGSTVLATADPHRGMDKVRSRFAVPLSEVGDDNGFASGRFEFASASAGKPAGLPG